jgi:long-chain fatty acid transport protein
MHKRTSLFCAAILVVGVSPALAAGFGFYENGASASAQAGAWVARANDASANWYNPAALVHLSGGEVQFGFNYLEIGRDTHFSSSLYGSQDAIGNGATPAHFFYSQKINDRIAWGVGLNNPFGLISEWNKPPLTFSSRRAELRTYLINPNLAFRLGNKWSLAIGADYLSAEVDEFSHDTVVLGIPTTANLRGEGDAWGYNAALQLKLEHFSFAGQYRSVLEPEIAGHVTFSGVPGTFLNSAATAELDLPAQILLGAAWTGKRMDVEVGAYQTRWDSFRKLAVETGNPATSVVLTENWNNTWSYRLGLAFRLGEEMKHELRAGGVFDASPVPVQYLRPSIPDSDRTGCSVGYGYLSKHWGIDVYAMYLWFADVTANGALSDGVFNGTYSSSIVLGGVTAKYRF